MGGDASVAPVANLPAWQGIVGWAHPENGVTPDCKSNGAAASTKLLLCRHKLGDQPQVPATIKALVDMHCKGSPAACDLGARHRRDQINGNYMERAEKTRVVLQTVGCFS